MNGNPYSGIAKPIQTAEWRAYYEAYEAYKAEKEAYDKLRTTITNQKSARIAEIATLQAQALRVTQEIEAEYFGRKDGLVDWVRAFVQARGLYKSDTNTDGIMVVDADRIIDTRFYMATHVTDWGEESAPSPVFPASGLLEVDQYSSVGVTLPTPPSGRNIAKWRLYRTLTGTATSAFQFVAELAIGSRTYSDTMPGEQLGEVIPTATWLEPPTRTGTDGVTLKGADPYLKGLVGMPNGVMAGYIDNFVAFCEPYVPYAWPVEYQIPIELPIVGLGVFGQTLFVGTLENPYLISGSDSASMSAIKLDSSQGCASAKSIVAVNGGVLYSSPDGVCFASNAGVSVITTELFAREDWQKLDPSSVIAVSYENVYYFWYSGNGGGCYAIDVASKKLARLTSSATAVFYDQLSDGLFLCTGSSLKKAMSTGRKTALWRSGVITTPKFAGLAWLHVEGAQSVGVPAIVRWFGDGALIYTATVTSQKPMRLPAGVFLTHEVEIESTARITKVVLSGSTQELQAV